MADPKYVRLVDRVSNGTLVDTYTHWSIAGRDVKEFPSSDEPRAAEFVRDALRRGVLEGASKGEFDEIQDAVKSLIESLPGTKDEHAAQVARAQQEGTLQRQITRHQNKVAAARAGDGDATFKADEKRRKALAKASKAAEKGTPVEDDEDEDDVEATETTVSGGGNAPTTTVAGP